MSTIQALVVDHHTPGHLALHRVDTPIAAPDEALVRVAAFSLNSGETRDLAHAEEGLRPGWDLAGTVIQQAADGSGPRQGTRVVGVLASGSWAEVVAVPTSAVAELPAAVSFAQAATLPTVGLTALWALKRGHIGADKTLLISGISSSVGLFAFQLAHTYQAQVVGVMRRKEQETIIKHVEGISALVIGDDEGTIKRYGPYHLALDTLGGSYLSTAMTTLAPGGICVAIGLAASPTSTFNILNFFLPGGTSLYGFNVFYEMTQFSTSEALAELAGMVANGQVHPLIQREFSWTDMSQAIQQQQERALPGKVVIHVGQ